MNLQHLIDEAVSEFDAKFGTKGPKANSDSEGRHAGCDDCVSNIEVREEHKDFLRSKLQSIGERAAREERERLLDSFRSVIFGEGIAEAIVYKAGIFLTPPEKEEESLYPLLAAAPPHDSPEFIDFLRQNNPVLHEDEEWLVIENCKYGWPTAFAKKLRPTITDELLQKYGHLEWRKKSKGKQTVPGRFHIHMCNP